MGLLRGFGAWVSRSILISALIFAIMLSGIGSLTNEDFVRDAIGATLEEGLGSDSEVSTSYQNMVNQCNRQVGNIITQEAGDDLILTFDCDELRAGTAETLKENALNQITAQILQQSVDKVTCDGFDCFSALKNIKDPLAVIGVITSQGFNTAIKTTTKLLFILALIGAVGVGLLSSGISGRVMGLGYPLTIAGLPYFGVGAIGSSLAANLPTKLLFAIQGFTNILSSRFLLVFSLGIGLLIVGLVLKYGFKMNGK